jgi:hypothetical protein
MSLGMLCSPFIVEEIKNRKRSGYLLICPDQSQEWGTKLWKWHGLSSSLRLACYAAFISIYSLTDDGEGTSSPDSEEIRYVTLSPL